MKLTKVMTVLHRRKNWLAAKLTRVIKEGGEVHTQNMLARELAGLDTAGGCVSFCGMTEAARQAVSVGGLGQLFSHSQELQETRDALTEEQQYDEA